MIRRPASPGAKKTRTRRQGRRWLLSVGLRIGIIFICFAASWVLWLDHRIRAEFEGKRWLLPARVYSSPMELYVDREITADALEEELRATGYRQSDSLTAAGQYSRNNTGIRFYRRRFQFWDGTDEAATISVNFSDNRISALRSGNDAVAVVRLDPRLIGKIYPRHNEDRVLVPYRDVPPFLVAALVAVEDRHFFSHGGLDFRGIARAMLVNLRRGRISQGGSTLTQQLVKNFFLSHDRTLWRKFNEMIMAVLLERRYSKAEILSAYINEVYLGQHGAQGIHGFGTAAEYYFARPLEELREDQIALLAGLVRGASYYNPFRHPERAIKRRNLVLQIMGKLKYAEPDVVRSARDRKLDLADRPRWSRAKYPAFLDLVRRQLLRDYRLEELQNEGLRVFTTLNPRLQDRMEAAAERKLVQLEKRKDMKQGTLELAGVVVNPGNGEVSGLIGGRQPETAAFNRALRARRPVGSLVKPVIYYAALSRPARFHVLSIVDDSPVSMQLPDGSTWQPRNYDRSTHQKVTLLEALSNSYNQATVRLGLDLGLDRIIDILGGLGVGGEIAPYPSLLLGAIEMSPLEVARIYQSFANGGFQAPVNSIREVLRSNGEALHRYPLEMVQVLDTAPVFLTNYLMTQVVARGTARGLGALMPGRLPLAGKTGTTNDLRDSWYAGFGDGLLGVIWLGRDDNEPIGLTGAGGAMRVWADIMRELGLKPLKLIPPEAIAWLDVSGGDCRLRGAVPYIRGFRPDPPNCR